MSITEKDNYQDMMEYVDYRLIPDINAKKERGEVFTPLNLINGDRQVGKKAHHYGGAEAKEESKGMLDHLPPEVWKNPNLKWLDPANGIGNFPICVYYRLMDGLRKVFPDNRMRCLHIIENMLYMVELDSSNVAISRSIFCERRDGEVINGNISQQDFTKYKKPKGWPEKFDVIMGNPPYNKGGVAKGGGVFWVEFVDKSIPLLNDNGILHFIHPKGWRKPYKDGDRKNNAGRIWYDFKRLGLLEYVNISDEPPKNFPKVDYYVWRKTTKPLNKLTIVENLFQKIYTISEIDISNLQFIPNLINGDSLDILNKMFNDRLSGNYFDIVYNQNFKPSKEDIGKSGVEHAFFYNVDTQTYNIAGRNMKEIPSYYNQPKMIMTYKSGKKPANLYAKLYTKEIGGTNNTMYQVCNQSEGSILEVYLNSSLIHFLLKITQYSEAPNYINEFKILNLLKIPQLKTPVSDKSIYEYYGLNKQNIGLIDAVISNSNYKPTKKQSTPSKSHTPKKSQQGGSTPNNKQLIKSYIKQHGSSIQNIYNNTKNNTLQQSSKSDRNAFYGIVNKFQSIVGGKQHKNPMNESNFTSLVKNITDSSYLKNVIKTQHIGGEVYSRRIKPLYNDYLKQFK